MDSSLPDDDNSTLKDQDISDDEDDDERDLQEKCANKMKEMLISNNSMNKKCIPTNKNLKKEEN